MEKHESKMQKSQNVYRTCGDISEIIEKSGKTAKRKNLWRIILICFAAILLVFAGTAAYIVNTRVVFANKTQMKNELQGTWAWFGELSDSVVYECYKFDGDKVYHVLSAADDESEDYISDVTNKTKYKPLLGTVKIGISSLRMQDGYLQNSEYDSFQYYKVIDFENELSWRENRFEKKQISKENGYEVLDIKGLKLYDKSLFTRVEGTIKNEGERTYRFVKVKASFKNKNGDVVDTDWTYAVGSEGIEAGESKKFEMSVDKDVSIESVFVKVISYD